jgi:hypothetical protein
VAWVFFLAYWNGAENHDSVELETFNDRRGGGDRHRLDDCAGASLLLRLACPGGLGLLLTLLLFVLLAVLFDMLLAVLLGVLFALRHG